MASDVLSDDQARITFDRASGKPYEGFESEWSSIVDLLRLPFNYLPAVQIALKQGRWRKSKNSIGYVRRVAKREAYKIWADPPLSMRFGVAVERTLRALVRRCPELAGELTFCIPIVPISQVAPEYTPDGERVSAEQFMEATIASCGDAMKDYEPERSPVYSVHKSFLLGHKEGNQEVNWGHVADVAGLDSTVAFVLRLRSQGASREQIMDAVDHDQRKAIRAAWNRLDRRKDELAHILRTGQAAGKKLQK